MPLGKIITPLRTSFQASNLEDKDSSQRVGIVMAVLGMPEGVQAVKYHSRYDYSSNMQRFVCQVSYHCSFAAYALFVVFLVYKSFCYGHQHVIGCPNNDLGYIYL